VAAVPPDGQAPVIRVRSVTVDAGSTRALDDVDLVVRAASVSRWSAPAARARPRCSWSSTAPWSPTVVPSPCSAARRAPPIAAAAPASAPCTSSCIWSGPCRSCTTSTRGACRHGRWAARCGLRSGRRR
jgi:hypothetical protein